jgi:hypothetical protein
VDLDTSLNPADLAKCCQRCFAHAIHNKDLIEQIPHASGDQLVSIFQRWKAQQPPAPKRNVQSLWGSYRVDPDNFVPSVTKVLDIVHSTGPKVRWSIKLTRHDQVPVTNLSSKEIILPNYFDSPNALGKTHNEILDAMTGAAMHEAGHAAYDTAETMIQAQRRIKAAPGQSTWASAMCLNIVCDYNLERKVLERYPAFRHYFAECHRWSVENSLPSIVRELQQDPDAENKMNVRLAVTVWEMLAPGDLAAAGGVITHKLRWITDKCFSILKYGYTKGHLNSEAGKLKVARAIYELVRVVDPVGYKPLVIVLPPSATPPPQQPPQPPQTPQEPPEVIFVQQGSQGDPVPPGVDVPEQEEQENNATDNDQPETQEDSGTESDTPGDSGQPGETGEDTDSPSDGLHPGSESDTGDPGEDSSTQEESGDQPGGEDQAPGDEGQGDSESDGHGTGGSPGSNGDPDESDFSGIPNDDSTSFGDEDEEDSEAQAGEAKNHDDREPTGQSGIADNTGPESQDPSGPVTQDGPATGPTMGGKEGSESPPDNDAFTGKSDLEDDPSRRKNARKDALDDLEEENANEPKIDESVERPITRDTQMDHDTRKTSENSSNVPEVQHNEVPKYEISNNQAAHEARVRELSPVISRLKKILRFRNADWGGRQTGRRSGTLTRRHVARLSAFGSDKVFHKTQPDATPKVRIALLIDESDSMNSIQSYGSTYPYISAKNAATALTQALHGIRGVKLWSWGYSLNRNLSFAQAPGQRRNIPVMRQYSGPFHEVGTAAIEAAPMSGGTPTGEAMDFAADTINKNSAPDEKKIVFVITDGEAGGYVSTATAVRKWTGKVTFVHIGIGNTVDPEIPFYIGPVTDVALLPDLLSESVAEILR